MPNRRGLFSVSVSLIICQFFCCTIWFFISFQDFYGRPAYNGTAELSIYIHEAFRKKGLGKQMLQYAISKAPDLEIHTLLGFVFEHNTNSIKMCESLGFETWGNLKNIAIMDNNHYSLKILGLKIS